MAILGQLQRWQIVVDDDDVLVAPGDTVEHDDKLITLETGKVELDIPSPNSRKIVELFVAAGDKVAKCQIFITLELKD